MLRPDRTSWRRQRLDYDVTSAKARFLKARYSVYMRSRINATPEVLLTATRRDVAVLPRELQATADSWLLIVKLQFQRKGQKQFCSKLDSVYW